MPTGIPQEGTDIGALALGYVSITPIKLNYTDHTKIPKLVEWGWPQAAATTNGHRYETAVPLLA